MSCHLSLITSSIDNFCSGCQEEIKAGDFFVSDIPYSINGTNIPALCISCIVYCVGLLSQKI